MFACRTNWNTKPNPISRKLSEIRESGAEIVDLTETNPTHCEFEVPGPEILQALTREEAMRYEPDPKGLPRTREAIADYYRRSGVDVDIERLFVVAGTSEAYGYLFRLLLEPGQTILVPSPSYPLLEFLADIHDVKLRPYPLHYDGRWWLDLDALRDAVDDTCRAIVSINPNNPTGSYLNNEELEGLRDLARTSGLALIVDEVFYDYALVDVEKPRSLSTDAALTFTLNGISKTLGLPQMKLSWLALDGPAPLVEAAGERLEIIADTYLSASTPIQLAACNWLSIDAQLNSEILHRIRANYEVLRNFAGLEALNVEGGWSAVLRISRTCPDEQFVLTLLEQDGILVDPGSFYGFASEGYVVLSLLPPPAVFRKGMESLNRRMLKEQ